MNPEDLDPNAALEVCYVCRRLTIVHCVDCRKPTCEEHRIRLSAQREVPEYQCHLCYQRERVPAQPKW